uniref:ER membrane protein complex subunit 6 n=1 Tax=Dunaliella tertiolecta TaxID=3047 RepID=A0A7S3RAU5_DUNTE|mmetsp:Transcript_27286/g.73744  ORF Transcript_27286/g.73744 Transcript_27286/m.73744 type:complete len:120 (-) Transcript_27286:837-1196(-)|eukprot:CAMPEP_0202351530 /NCGR_PEP_ID=MMETSP1126-20121109/8126_1 /ASSEMBLY_ACC=CAM_ASM_000457 /TAXON_ID=3047 /ORGANISM="Dunaliella tertiolecta, Strain CCMP1320" /LENGTH=119 /DNA_ID=CAMNT_0048943641 /DNA_START=165 /DNA_END=524 /DNA_ORIENTATION=+
MPPRAQQQAQAKRDIKPSFNINPNNLRHNIGVLAFFRTFVAIITGIVVGILGVEGWWGFLPMLGTQFLCAPAMFLKGATSPEKYFHSWSNFLLGGVFSSTTLLTYILFWMISFNLCHIF